MPERTALVTGATGYIGSRLVCALSAAGWPVRACGRRPRPSWMPADVDYRVLDLAAGPGVSDVCRGVGHVFHLAGASSSLSSQAEMDRANVGATEHLVAAATGNVERVIYMSSTSVYGEDDPLPLPVSEDAECRPSRGYGKSKWHAEQVLRAAAGSGLGVSVLRPVSVFGPGNIKLLASAVLDVAIERFVGYTRLDVPAEPVEQRLVHIDDVVRACLHVAADPTTIGGTYNVVVPAYPTSHDVAEILADEFGMGLWLSDDPDCGLAYDGRAVARQAMIDGGMHDDILLTEQRLRFMGKANRNNRLSVAALLATGFSFEQADLDTAIRRTVGWYRDRRWVL